MRYRKVLFKVLLVGLFGTGIFSFSAHAQHFPVLSDFSFYSSYYNPALTSISGKLDLALAHRQQWTGLKGAPQTSLFRAETPLKIKGYNNFHGLGGYVMRDAAGSFSRIDVAGNYAFHLQVSESMFLSAGISGGIRSVSIQASEVQIPQEDDPLAYGQGLESFLPEGNLGLALSGVEKPWYVGLGLQQFLALKARALQTVRVANVVGEYRIALSESTELIPRAFFLQRGSQSLAIAELGYDYKNIVQLGLRAGLPGKVLGGTVGLRVMDGLHLRYTYELNEGEIGRVQLGTHQIGLRFRTATGEDKKRKRRGPKLDKNGLL